MIIEHQADDHIVYSNATMKDFMRVVRNANILLSHPSDSLERVQTETGQVLYHVTRDDFGEHKWEAAVYNSIDQEITCYF